MDDGLCLMAVHAHPDDEAISTGGVLAAYSAQGVRTVLVTCTNGEQGDGPGGVKPGELGHDESTVVAVRRKELERSCEILGVTHLELLGYRDSGMMGWPANEAPGSFWTTPVEEAAGRLSELIRRHGPQVVVSYDSNGFYGHPDHIQAHRVTVAAFKSTGIPFKRYETAVPRSALKRFAEVLAAGGEDRDPPDPSWGTADEAVTTAIDVSRFARRKYEALAAHASQGDNLTFIRLGPDAFAELFTTEYFVRAEDRTGAPVPEADLFAGLR